MMSRRRSLGRLGFRSRLSAVQNKTVADKHFFDRYVAPTPIVAATLDARGAVGSLAAEDLDYWLGESSSVYAIGMST